MSSTNANSFFGCLGVLCEHYGMTMSLTPEALRESLAESEDLSAVESALGEAGFEVARLPLVPENLQSPDQPFPLLARRRDGGFVLIVGVTPANDQLLIGVFDPDQGEDRAQSWTPKLVARLLTGEGLHAIPLPGAEPSPGTREAATAQNVGGSLPRKRKASPDIFADAVENIRVDDGVVRIGLASYSPKEKRANDEPALTTTGCLVMPVEGFVKAFGAIGEVVRQMVAAGAIEGLEVPAAIRQPNQGRKLVKE